MIKQFIGLVLCILLGLSLNSCQRTEEPQENEVVTNTSRSLSIELSSELDPEEAGLSIDELRSLAFVSGGARPMLHVGKSDWTGHLFFRKVGDDRFVGYAAITWEASYDTKKRKIVLQYRKNLTLENAPDLPKVGETWYVAAVLGGGSLSDDKRSISFAASGVQETAQGVASGLDVPFVSKWTPLSIKANKSAVIRTAHFAFAPKGFLTRATITNKTNYDYRIYRNMSVNGKLSPALPRLVFQVIDANTEKLGYLGLSLNFSNAKNSETSLRSGTVSSEAITKTLGEGGVTYGDISAPIYPNPNDPITIRANGGSCSLLLWNYAAAQDLRVLIRSALPDNRRSLFSPASFRLQGSTVRSPLAKLADQALNISASKVADGKSYRASFELYRRATMAIDHLLSSQQERMLHLPEITSHVLTPLEYAEIHYQEDFDGVISSWRTIGLGLIFPSSQRYFSKSTSGTPVFEKGTPIVPNYSFGTAFTYDMPYGRIKGMGDGKTIYALNFTPTKEDRLGMPLSLESFLLWNGGDRNLWPYLDGDMQVAYRYEYTDYPEGRNLKALKVTARYLGNAWSGDVENIAKPSFWNTNSERNVVYYFPQNRGYLKQGSKGGSFLGFNQNIANALDSHQTYYMEHFGFSEWGLWGESYVSTRYRNPGGGGVSSAIYMQPLDERRFGLPHYYSPQYLNEFYKDLP